MSRMRNTIRRAAFLLGATAAAAAVAGPAQAAQLQSWSGTDDSNGKPYHYVFYDAANGVDNNLRITSDGVYVTFDDVEAIAPGPGCGHPGSDQTVARCSQAGLTAVLVRLADGRNKAVDTTSLPMSISAAANSVDDFDGGPGPDELTGGDNADTLVGGSGDDTLRGNKGNDTFFDQSGRDSVAGGDGADVFHAGTGADTYAGGANTDAIRYDDRSQGVAVTLDDVADDGGPNEGDDVGSDVENVYGSQGIDTIIAQRTLTVANRLYGNGGDDTILAGPGNDPAVSGGAGRDDVRGEAGDDAVYGGAGEDVLWGGPGTDVLWGDAENDQLSGGPGADTSNGGTGTDTAYYADVNERVTVDLDGAAGDDGAQGEGDTTKADVENITGGTASDTLTGNDGPNVIRGGAGNDTIDGLLGADELFGDADRDSLLARDGIADKVDCGADADDARVDGLDAVTGCEDVDRGTKPDMPVTPQGPGTPGTPQAPQVGALKISPKTLRLDRKGFARLTVSCPKGASKKCTGSVKVQRSTKGRTRTVGSRRFKVVAGRTVAVKVKVQKAVRTALARRKVKVTVVASARDAASTTVTAKRAVTFLRTAR